MDAKRDFDLAVIGGGPGGYTAAIRASRLGFRTALIEARELGGTCLNRGCIPVKALLHSAEVFRRLSDCSKLGIHASGVSFDYAEISERKERIVSNFRRNVESLVKGSGCSVFSGMGYPQPDGTVRIEGNDTALIHAKKTILATGSEAFLPRIAGSDEVKVFTSDDLLALRAVPSSLLIVGGGAVGVEFAEIFHSFGTRVTIIEMMEHILPGVDEEISDVLESSLKKRGITVLTGARVESLSPAEGVCCAYVKDGVKSRVSGEIILMAVGRKPKTESLSALPVCDDRGRVRTNEYCMTSIPSVFAVGDATGKAMLAHTAYAHAAVAVDNLGGRKSRADYALVPACVYTNPEIASVGLSEKSARDSGYTVKVGSFPVGHNGKAIVMGETEGLAKIVTDAKTGEILGAHIAGPRATDMITEITAVMKIEGTIDELISTIHPHPTVSEIMYESALDMYQMSAHKSYSKERYV
jgi:dihydrolipoamide dehydrogenase